MWAVLTADLAPTVGARILSLGSHLMSRVFNVHAATGALLAHPSTSASHFLVLDRHRVAAGGYDTSEEP